MRFTKLRPRLGDRSMPFVSMDWFFPIFPNITKDKFHWFSRYIQGSFASGAAFILFVYHTPFASANYDHEYQSPLYRWKKDRMIESGKLAENSRIKYRSLYAVVEE